MAKISAFCQDDEMQVHNVQIDVPVLWTMTHEGYRGFFNERLAENKVRQVTDDLDAKWTRSFHITGFLGIDPIGNIRWLDDRQEQRAA